MKLVEIGNPMKQRLLADSNKQIFQVDLLVKLYTALKSFYSHVLNIAKSSQQDPEIQIFSYDKVSHISNINSYQNMSFILQILHYFSHIDQARNGAYRHPTREFMRPTAFGKFQYADSDNRC